MELQKPARLFDRDEDWAALARFAEDERPGPQLGVVRGRRRHGKSALLRALVEAAGGWYHQALEGTRVAQLRDLAGALRGPLGAEPRLQDWSEAFRVLLDSEALPRLIVLDEASYLVGADPSLASRLQAELDARAQRGRATRLVLCGSGLSIMSTLLVGAAPRRGRASLELPVRPFALPEAARFLGIDDPVLAVWVHGVIGGVPGYAVDLLGGDVPGDRGDFDDWVVRGALSTRRPLLYEARHLLDEPGVRDRGWYLAVLAALAGGRTTNARIGGLLERDSASVAQALGVLADLGLVARREDVLRRGRPSWAVLDPLLRFWLAVTRPDWTRVEAGLAAAVWGEARGRWRAQVLGPAVEEELRRWCLRSPALGPVGRIGTARLTDASSRTTHEIDVVGLDPGASGTRVAVLGEAKAGSAGAGELERLRGIRDLLTARGLADAGTRLVLCGLERVDRRLAADDVLMLDADDLVAG